jgi:hypothetical protein
VNLRYLLAASAIAAALAANLPAGIIVTDRGDFSFRAEPATGFQELLVGPALVSDLPALKVFTEDTVENLPLTSSLDWVPMAAPPVVQIETVHWHEPADAPEPEMRITLLQGVLGGTLGLLGVALVGLAVGFMRLRQN